MDNAKPVGAIELSDAIENILIESGLSISEFSRKVGYSRQYLYALLKKGDSTVSHKVQLDTLKQICDATGYGLRRLLGDLGYIPKRQSEYPPNSIIIVKGSDDKREYDLDEKTAQLIEEVIKSLAKKK